MNLNQAKDECDSCYLERIGCGCDGAYDDGCFLCTPKKHDRPACPESCARFPKKPTFDLAELSEMYEDCNNASYRLAAIQKRIDDALRKKDFSEIENDVDGARQCLQILMSNGPLLDSSPNIEEWRVRAATRMLSVLKE